MSSIAYLCRQRIEIDSGTVTESTEPDQIGTIRFFVSFFDEDDARLVLWDGTEHSDAARIASECASDFRVPVIDRSRRHA